MGEFKTIGRPGIGNINIKGSSNYFSVDEYNSDRSLVNAFIYDDQGQNNPVWSVCDTANYDFISFKVSGVISGTITDSFGNPSGSADIGFQYAIRNKFGTVRTRPFGYVNVTASFSFSFSGIVWDESIQNEFEYFAFDIDSENSTTNYSKNFRLTANGFILPAVFS